MSNGTIKNVIGNEMTVNALIHLCGENYRKVALKAMGEGIQEVLIPAEPNQDMLDLLEDVNQLRIIMTSGNDGNVPVYTCYSEFLSSWLEETIMVLYIRVILLLILFLSWLLHLEIGKARM